MMGPTSRWVTYAGIATAASGFGLIAYTWSRVAPLELVALQLPWIVSAGFTGLGLIMVGATIVNVQAKRYEGAQRERQLRRLEHVMDQIAAEVRGSTPTESGSNGQTPEPVTKASR
jgi:hypothetical protein